jgi:3-hydroxyisobutyrate dehydrogenase
MLPAGRHVAQVYLGDGGIVGSAQPGALLIDCSTIDVATARAVAEDAEAAGMIMLDAPVSGGVAGAAAATLTFMVGGTPDAFAAPSRCLNPWARPSFMPAARATARRRRSATT